MKRFIKGARGIILAICMILTSVFIPSGNLMKVSAAGDSEIRACWISFMEIQFYLKDTKEADFRRYIGNMCDRAKGNSLNTLIVQVRPMGDAIYPSAIYPWSEYITSGRKNPGYDPLAIMVEVAHEKGIRLEAWFNPFRLTNASKMTGEYKNTTFYKKNKDCIIEYEDAGEKKLSLDPGNGKARQIIVDGVSEVVRNYDVDGVHFDDYFYVNGMKDSLDMNSRKNNVNMLVKAVHDSVKAIDSNCVFGISPAGNIENCRAIGADVDKWLSEEGYVDYIMPQIYWSDSYLSSYTGKYISMYTDRCKAWKELNKIGIPMYVGLALYKVGKGDANDRGWANANNILATQYVTSREMGYSGYALFRYAWLDYSINPTIKTGDAAKDAKIIKYAEAELENLKNAADSYMNEPGSIDDSYIAYSTHIQSIGWQNNKVDGVLSGTTGLGKRLEAIKISLGKKAGKGSVSYRTHCQSYGWLPWVSDGEISGTSGESKRMEAIQIRLEGAAAEKFDIYYRVHVQSFGWLDWACNGEAAGSATYGKRLEAIQIKLVKKGKNAPGETANPYMSRMVQYNCHVQSFGWLDNSFDGQASGTTGLGKRLEAIRISIPDNLNEGNIVYRTHCQSYGWLDWVSNGVLSGTSGEAKRLEAIQIKLEGKIAENYDVFYRVHCQTYGWMDWVSNGELAGTEGEAKRLESIQIVILPKGTTP